MNSSKTILSTYQSLCHRRALELTHAILCLPTSEEYQRSVTILSPSPENPHIIMGDLLKLPRELRDQIYSHALVHPKIEVCISDSDDSSDQLRSSWPSCNTRYCLSCLLGLQYGHDKRCKKFHRLTYKLCRPNLSSMNLFFTSRQVYTESSEIFYGQKRFEFSDQRFRVVTLCSAFLYDRPLRALQLFRHITLFEPLDFSFSTPYYVRCASWQLLRDTVDKIYALRTFEKDFKKDLDPKLKAVDAADPTTAQRRCLNPTASLSIFQNYTNLTPLAGFFGRAYPAPGNPRLVYKREYRRRDLTTGDE